MSVVLCDGCCHSIDHDSVPSRISGVLRGESAAGPHFEDAVDVFDLTAEYECCEASVPFFDIEQGRLAGQGRWKREAECGIHECRFRKDAHG